MRLNEPTGRSRSGKGITLYKSDLHELIDLMRPLFKSLEVRTEKYAYDSPEEFLEKTKETNVEKLEITGNGDSNVYVEVNRNRFVVWTISRDVGAHGATERIFDFLYKKPRRRATSYGQLPWLFIIGSAIYATINLLCLVKGVMHFWFFAFNMVSAIVIGQLDKVKPLWENAIYPQEDRPSRGFLERNWDKIALLVIGGFFTTLIKALWDHIANK